MQDVDVYKVSIKTKQFVVVDEPSTVFPPPAVEHVAHEAKTQELN